jgi:hypothetical protein
MNITLSIDERTLSAARKVAAARGQSLNQLIRDELSRLTGEEHRRADWQELESLSGTGHSGRAIASEPYHILLDALEGKLHNSLIL